MPELPTRGGTFTIERAAAADVPAIVALLADDVLGATREHADLAVYEAAFAAVDADPRQFLAVVRDAEARVCATCQLTLIPGLSRGGATRLQIEAVRVAASARGHGLGTAMLQWAHDYGRRHGAVLAQLTTDAQRPEALRFYERLGYVPSHVGCKLALDPGHGGDEGEGASGIGTTGEPDADAAPGEDMTDAAGPFGGAVTR